MNHSTHDSRRWDSQAQARAEWLTLADVVRGSARLANRAGIYVVDRRGNQEFRTYPRILEAAHRAGAALRVEGVEPHDRVLIVMPMGFDFLAAFFGAALIGATPVPFAPPEAVWRPGDSEPACVRAARRFRARAVLLDAQLDKRVAGPAGPALVGHLADLIADVPVGAAIEPQTSLPDVAYVQLTSGATGTPRGVEVTHANILASVRAIGASLGVTAHDVGVSWVPPHNPMGLVGILCFGIYWGIDMVHLAPERFMKHPEEWLSAISRHGGTLSTAPNFAYHYAVRRCKESNLAGLDLSTWRVAMSGAEPVRAEHMQAFVDRFSAYGLAEDVFVPVYGLSEATLGVTFADRGSGPVVDRISRFELEHHGLAICATLEEGGDHPRKLMRVVSVGRALEGVEVAVWDEDGDALEDRRLGEIAIRGPNLARGYTEDERSVSGRDPRCARYVGSWLATGDLGYLVDGQLFVVGRACDVIDRPDGRQVFPEELEHLINSVDGIRAGSAAVFAAARDAEGGEPVRLVAAFEIPAGSEPDVLRDAVFSVLEDQVGLRPDEVLALAPGSVPKTSSGKVRRFLAQNLYQRDHLDVNSRQSEARLTRRLARRAVAEASRLGGRFWSRFKDTLPS